MTECKLHSKKIKDVLEACKNCDRLCGCEILKNVFEKAQENFEAKKVDVPKRTNLSIYENFKNKSFTSIPNDKIIILHMSGVISSSITLNLINKERDEDIIFAVDNKIESWRWLKKINEYGGRKVTYKIDDNKEMKYEDSEPYKYRF